MVVFGTIMVIGFLVLLLSLLLGEIGEHAGDIAHEIVVEHDVEGTFDHNGDVEHQEGGPSVFSLRFLAAFATGFGGGGAIGRFYDLDYFISSLIGLGLGVVVGIILYFIVSFLYKQQASSGVSVAELVGKTAMVIVGIPQGGTGQVTLTHKGATVTQMAKAASGQVVNQGSSVTIKAVTGDYVIVG